MKYIILIVSLLQFVVGFSQDGVIDKVVAQVGENIILLSDLQSQKIQAIQEGDTDTNKMDCEFLEQLLYQNLLINQAKLDSVEVTDVQVDGEMENRLRVIISQIGSREKLEEFYGKTVAQIKEEFRPAIKNRLLSQEMERQITENITVSPKEVRDFYNQLPKDSIPYINSKLKLQQVIIYPQITEEDRKRSIDFLNKIREQILAGERTFKTMAVLYSEDPGSRGQGGEIAATRGQMVPPFESAVFALKPGEISPVIETEYGYHIIQLESRRGDDYICRHILVIPTTSDEELAAATMKIDECYQKLKKDEINWENAVLNYSNDVTTKWNHGDLANPVTGEQLWDMENLNQIDRQIYILVNSVDDGGFSQPSTYDDAATHKTGFRIIRLADRTEPHVANLTDDYQLVQNAAISAKKQKTIADWVKNKINNAYCRIDDEFKDCKFLYNWGSK